MEIFFVLFLSLLITAHGTAEYELQDNIAMFAELESFDIYEEIEDEVEAFGMPSWTSSNAARFLVNVDSFGAIGDGTTDDTQVILKWQGYSFNDESYSCMFNF